MKEWIHTFLCREPQTAGKGAVLFPTRFDEDLKEIIRQGVGGRHTLPWSSPETYHAWKTEKIRTEFSDYWENRFCPESQTSFEFPWLEEEEAVAFLDRAAAEGSPVLDLASDFCMGMLPFLLRKNLMLPVCASDLDAGTMEVLAEQLQCLFPSGNVCTASFDNNDIPVRDGALRYVTGIDAMYSTTDPDAGMDCRWSYCLHRERAVREVYRILQPGGYFIAEEKMTECDWDLMTLWEVCGKEKLFGVLSFSQIQEVIGRMTRDQWRNVFEETGFSVQMEKKYLRRLMPEQRKRFLLRYTGCVGQQKQIPAFPEEPDTPEDIGLEIYEGSVFYVLQKN